MKAPETSPPELGPDDVIRFVDLDHFLREVDGNLGRGRALVRSQRPLSLNAQLLVGIEAPLIGQQVWSDAVVVYAKEGLLGLEIVRFREEVESQLVSLREAAEARFQDLADKTVIVDVPPFLPQYANEAYVPFGQENGPESNRISDILTSPHRPAQGSAPPSPRVRIDEGPSMPAGSFEPPFPAWTPAVNPGSPEEHTPPPRSPPPFEQTPRSPGLDLVRGPLTETPGVEISPEEQAPPPPLPDALLRSLPSDGDEPWSRPRSRRPDPPPSPRPETPKTEASNRAAVEDAVPDVPDLPDLPDRAALLTDAHPALLRARPDGALEVSEPVELLGLFLTQLRHGKLTLLDGPSGARGQPVTLKLTGAADLELHARIAARAGPWVTLDITDVDPVQTALSEASEWRATLKSLFPPPPPPPDVRDEAPRETSTTGAAPPPPEEPAPPNDPPRLQGDQVLFAGTADLVHELKSHLASGGLFVQSKPLPIRERRELDLVVGGVPWGVRLEADVVFAHDGRVGFSVTNAAEVRARLEDLLAARGPERSDETADLSVDLSPGSSQRTGDLCTFRGILDAPLTERQLLNLSRQTLSDLSAEKLAASQIVQLIVRERWRGVLTITSGRHTLRAWFHRGDVAFVTSEPFDDARSVGRILINQKKLNESALREALDKSTSTSRPLGRTLVALGSVRKSDLVMALREQTRLKLEVALELAAGTYEWTPWHDPPGNADLILTRGLSVLGRFVRNRLESLNANEVDRLFGSDLGRVVVRDQATDPTSSGLNLQPKELRFLELQFDGERSIQDATLGSPLGRLASLRLVALCLAVGLLRFADGGTLRSETLRKKNAAALALEHSLREHLASLQGQNHFDVLGVHWSAHPRNYEEAWERARQEFAQNAEPIRNAPDSVKALAREVLGAIETSFQTLKDRDQRIRYRNEVFDQTERAYAADMLVKQGEVALIRGDRTSAFECLETAVELHPTPRTRALLASARGGRS